MRLTFIKKWHETANVWSFLFAPAEPHSWLAGQSLRLEVPGSYGPLEHRFSIASAPSSGAIMVTTRLSGSEYKEGLDRLDPGDTVDAYAIEGDFTWREHEHPHIFAAAGIGVTPLHAMLAERAAHGQPVTATFLYHTRDTPAPYQPQLEAWQRIHPKFEVHYFNERLSIATILALPHASHRLIYISGPSKMVDTLSADLLAAGVSARHIMRDQFTGRLPLDG